MNVLYYRLFGNLNKRIVYTAFILFMVCITSYLMLLMLQDRVIGRDARIYLSTVKKSSETWHLTPLENKRLSPPLLLMLMLHAEHYLGISAEIAGLTINLICGALCSVIVFLGCWLLSNEYFFSLLSGILFFLIPGIRDVSIDILRDAPSLCLNLSSMIFIMLYIKTKRPKHLVLCGFLLSISLGFRYENLEFILLYSILIVYVTTSSLEKGLIIINNAIRELCYFACGMLLGASIVFYICQQSEFFSWDNISKTISYYYLML